MRPHPHERPPSDHRRGSLCRRDHCINELQQFKYSGCRGKGNGIPDDSQRTVWKWERAQNGLKAAIFRGKLLSFGGACLLPASSGEKELLDGKNFIVIAHDACPKHRYGHTFPTTDTSESGHRQIYRIAYETKYGFGLHVFSNYHRIFVTRLLI